MEHSNEPSDSEERNFTLKLNVADLQKAYPNLLPYCPSCASCNPYFMAQSGYIVTTNLAEQPAILVYPSTEIDERTSIADARHKELMSKLDELLQKQEKGVAEIKELIQKENITIIDCIKYNAAKNLQLICLFGIALTLFSLSISLFLKIHLINPLFAFLMLVTSIGFFIMIKSEERRIKRHDK